MTVEPQSAMVLTEQEWADVADIARRYIAATGPLESPPLDSRGLTDLLRRRALCRRIIEATA